MDVTDWRFDQYDDERTQDSNQAECGVNARDQHFDDLAVHAQHSADTNVKPVTYGFLDAQQNQAVHALDRAWILADRYRLRARITREWRPPSSSQASRIDRMNVERKTDDFSYLERNSRSLDRSIDGVGGARHRNGQVVVSVLHR